MNQDARDVNDPADEQDPRDDYVAPTLKSLGSFEDLTRLGTGTTIDSEGAS